MTHLHGLVDSSYFDAKFQLHDNAQSANQVPPALVEIVTGFGPTNAPTAGTLSVILRAKALAEQSGMHATVIVSNLGAWCSRRVGAIGLGSITARFLSFMPSVGLQEPVARVRTHEDLDILRIAGILTRYLDEQILNENEEATTALYGQLNLLGNRFGVWTDTAYTVADILEPILIRRKKRVLVLAGLEEHYFVRLARSVLDRMRDDPDCPFSISDGVDIGALYARIIGGLPPYPKMSKSIPASAIGLGETTASIEAKILGGPAAYDPILLQMMACVSDWSADRVRLAQTAFDRREMVPLEWAQARQEYLADFTVLKQLWESAEAASPFPTVFAG
ncbi:MAG: hypothetical protein HYX55_03890 [Chloroflexi bacterium]|nr:hypothetical protein [Chloroflexota bacterium]